MVNTWIAGLIGQVVTATLIVAATRWIMRRKGFTAAYERREDEAVPKVQGGQSVYRIKPELRVAGFSFAIFFGVVSVWGMIQSASPVSLGMLLALGLVNLGLANGTVVTDADSVRKSVFWASSKLSWKEIEEIRVHKGKDYAIELRGKSRRVFIDSRFAAKRHLLHIIQNNTKLQPNLIL